MHAGSDRRGADGACASSAVHVMVSREHRGPRCGGCGRPSVHGSGSEQWRPAGSTAERNRASRCQSLELIDGRASRHRSCPAGETGCVFEPRDSFHDSRCLLPFASRLTVLLGGGKHVLPNETPYQTPKLLRKNPTTFFFFFLLLNGPASRS